MITLHELADIGEIGPGDDLASILSEALNRARLVAAPGDVLVVTQKIVSKAEGRFAALRDVTPGAEALRLAEITRKDSRLVELVLMESSEIIRAAPHVLIVRHRSGHVMANAGIDRSNIGQGREDHVLLLPRDPDASARSLHAALAARLSPAPAVVISDSFGRPWRMGVTNVAIGAAGFPVLVDRRGDLDRDGRVLEVTQIAQGDMVAAAAGLAMGEGAEGVPAVLIRGLRLQGGEAPATALVRPLAEDLFR
jgi:coenzyme F420-0:L-glutamate ligase/coenzyme F420-1:gamma-L-glutamate ligase